MIYNIPNFCDEQSLEERCQRILQDMEGSLTARDRVGIQDFVLLDAYTSETAFIDNLRKRFNENLIYVSATPTHMTSWDAGNAISSITVTCIIERE